MKNEFDIPMTVEFTKEVDDMATLSSAFRSSVEMRVRQEERQEMAADMLKDQMPFAEIVKYSRLTNEAVEELAKSMGVQIIYDKK